MAWNDATVVLSIVAKSRAKSKENYRSHSLHMEIQSVWNKKIAFNPVAHGKV